MLKLEIVFVGARGLAHMIAHPPNMKARFSSLEGSRARQWPDLAGKGFSAERKATSCIDVCSNFSAQSVAMMHPNIMICTPRRRSPATASPTARGGSMYATALGPWRARKFVSGSHGTKRGLRRRACGQSDLDSAAYAYAAHSRHLVIAKSAAMPPVYKGRIY